MSIKRTFIKGTFLLTAAGMISRLIGFYYRIFLTHTIGAEGIGIYQLIFPVQMLCYAITSSGIQTTISRLVAANNFGERRSNQIRILKLGMLLSAGLSAVVSILLYFHSDWIAIHIIDEARCADLLKILACTIPLCSINASVCGYYYGIKNASIPSFCQLGEQLVRVFGVYLMVTVCTNNRQPVTVDLAVWGLVLGEAASTLIAVTAVKYHQASHRAYPKSFNHTRHTPYTTLLSQILGQSVPLTMNRMCITVLQSTEAILIPAMLKRYGETTLEALSTYGILMGMAMPLVLFPSALTNSVSVMLLPAVAEAQAEQKTASIKNAVENSIKYCLFLGIYCTGIFLFLGNDMGTILFHTPQAGKFIATLAWICPFLYLTTTLGSIVHGLGKTLLYFVYNCLSLLVRIGFVIFCIPRFGILGYLWGILASQLLLTLLLLYCLYRDYPIRFRAIDNILIPAIYITCATLLCQFFNIPLEKIAPSALLRLTLQGTLTTLVYLSLAIYYKSLPFHLPKNQKHLPKHK